MFFICQQANGNFYLLENKYTDTSSILLKEVVVLSEPSNIFSSETPKKMSEIRGALPIHEPFQEKYADRVSIMLKISTNP
jgi:hypothetical protein